MFSFMGEREKKYFSPHHPCVPDEFRIVVQEIGDYKGNTKRTKGISQASEYCS
jgi:hypothetical protein